MNVAEILEQREPDWKELERITKKFRSRLGGRKANSKEIARFSSLYRSACSDLALAESYQLPAGVVQYLNNLVGLAHHQLYQNADERRNSFWRTFFVETPRSIVSDALFWTATGLFWIPFITTFLMANNDATFAQNVVGTEALSSIETMYADLFDQISGAERFQMIVFYIVHNGGIGIRSFAFGILGGFGGLGILLSNAVQLGSIFGFMTGTEVDPETKSHFVEFVTAHGPFELTAIVMSAAAGMRMGFAFIFSRGYKRLDSVKIAARQTSPILAVALVLFCLAACLEAFLSPYPLNFLDGSSITPLAVKQAVAIVSTALLFGYIVVLGLVALFKT